MVVESEETSAEMLKNTPSNIRRLTNEIEQCEGRQKYLAQTRSPSDGGDVRWYFCKVPLAENGQFLFIYSLSVYFKVFVYSTCLFVLFFFLFFLFVSCF